MNVKKIENRGGVYRLVDAFYEKVRSNDLLSPLFELHIEDWPLHLNRLTDFWGTNLFFVRKFKGNPSLKHHLVDASSAYSINELYFGTWLNLWFETADELFIGEKAEIAKTRAFQMSTFFHVHIFKTRLNSIY